MNNFYLAKPNIKLCISDKPYSALRVTGSSTSNLVIEVYYV